MKISIRVTHALFAAALMAGTSASALAEDVEHWRLFVADHTEPVVRAIELKDGSEAGRFDLDAFATLYRSQGGRSVFAVQGEANRVAVIASGITLEDHGDHPDIEVDAPRLLPIALEGERPAHFVEHGGSIAMFYDGEGRADIVSESDFHAGQPTARSVSADEPHHGLVAPMGDYFVRSVPFQDTDRVRPNALRVVDAEGNGIGEDVACPGLHGEASSGPLMAFGCRDGVIIASPGSGGVPVLQHLPSASMGEGNVSTLRGGTALRFFLGNFGPTAVVLVEPGAAEPFRRIELPSRRVDFAVDPAQVRDAYVLTEDGLLHRIDVIAGTIAASARVTEPYSMDGHWRDPRPRLAVAGGHLAVTDPLAGLIRLIDTRTLAEDRAIAVEGVPYSIVAVGGSGRRHDH